MTVRKITRTKVLNKPTRNNSIYMQPVFHMNTVTLKIIEYSFWYRKEAFSSSEKARTVLSVALTQE